MILNYIYIYIIYYILRLSEYPGYTVNQIFNFFINSSKLKQYRVFKIRLVNLP